MASNPPSPPCPPGQYKDESGRCVPSAVLLPAQPEPQGTAGEIIHSLPSGVRAAGSAIAAAYDWLKAPPEHPATTSSPKTKDDPRIVVSTAAGEAQNDPQGKPVKPPLRATEEPTGVPSRAAVAGMAPHITPPVKLTPDAVLPYPSPGGPGDTLTSLSERTPEGGLRSTAEAEAAGLKYRAAGADRGGDRFAADRVSAQAAQARAEEQRLKAPGGGWTFSGGYAETGKVGPREGYRRPSGIESALSRREFMDRFEEYNRAEALTKAQHEAEMAKSAQAVEYAQMDPLAMARIQAESRYGAEAIKQKAEFEQRQRAVEQLKPLIEAALNEPDPAKRRTLMEGAAALANAWLGQRVALTPQDLMSMLLGQGALGQGVVGAAGGAGTPSTTQ